MSLSLSATLSLLLTLTAILLVSQGQGAGFVLSFRRPVPNDVNRILLECRHSSNATLALNAVFFRSGLRYDIPNSAVIPNFGVRFVVDRTSEGNFTCGDGVSVSFPAVTIVTRPDSSDRPQPETFFADVGSTARLDCSITPGLLLPLYYVTWRNASDPSVIFYQTFPIRSNGQMPPTVPNDRYSLDFQNFSLFISDVGLPDAADDYQCVLGVVEPRDNQLTEFMFTRTAEINLSLSLYTAPTFVEEPSSQVVVAGVNVTFTCAVFSSPGESTIDWRLGEMVLDRHDDRFSITTEVVSDNSGKRTDSSLIIFRVTGFDSNTVECFSEYLVNAAVMVSTVRSETTLSVLDEVQLQTPIPFESGGFIFPIIPKRPLLIPVMVELLYTDADDSTLQATVQSVTTFFNNTAINVIEFSEQVPYDEFFLGVSLFYRDVQGPMIQSNNVFSQPGPEPFTTAFWILLGLMILLIALVATVVIVLVCLMKCRKKNGLDGALNILNTTKKKAQINSAIVCCCVNQDNSLRSDGTNPNKKSENGFTEKLAKKFVSGIVQAIKFGENDSMIKVELKTVKLSSAGADQYIRALSQSPAHRSGFPNGAPRTRSPNPSGSLGSVGIAMELPGTSTSMSTV